MDLPQYISATQVVKDADRMRAKLPDNRWVPTRGIRPNYIALKRRLQLAWMVFTGKADALTWEA